MSIEVSMLYVNLMYVRFIMKHTHHVVQPFPHQTYLCKIHIEYQHILKYKPEEVIVNTTLSISIM